MSVLLAAVPGFSGNQTVLNPVGEGAARIEHNFALIFWITSTVYLVTVLVLVIAVWRRRHTSVAVPAPQQTTQQGDRFAVRAVAAAMGVTLLLLFVMLITSFKTSHALGTMNHAADAVEIEVIGHQWWWEVRYPNPEASKMVTTANEIHIPVGVPVRIHGTSSDVIHSFWAPNVQGKRDFMPGYENQIVMQVDKEGRWRGQCAEFCGLQHAHMSFFFVAEPVNTFKEWLANGAQSAVAPNNAQLQHGRQVFLSHDCIMCHAIGGITAGGRVGPDLTHLAGRATIGAGELPNDADHLAKWIVNAQTYKPGSRMPPNQLSQEDLNDLVTYLEALR